VKKPNTPTMPPGPKPIEQVAVEQVLGPALAARAHRRLTASHARLPVFLIVNGEEIYVRRRSLKTTWFNVNHRGHWDIVHAFGAYDAALKHMAWISLAIALDCVPHSEVGCVHIEPGYFRELP
jgi:hypothetical protein